MTPRSSSKSSASATRAKRRSASAPARASERNDRSGNASRSERSRAIARGRTFRTRSARLPDCARCGVPNVRDSLANGSRLAVLAIKDCEKGLDQIERKIDEQLPGAITRVGEAKARELLACLKFITDLERIGDLAYSAIMQLESRREKLPAADSRQLVEMSSLLCEMLEQVHQGFLTRDPAHAQSVLHSDPEVDRLCHALFRTLGRAKRSGQRAEFRYPARCPGTGAHRRSRQEPGRRDLRIGGRPIAAAHHKEAFVLLKSGLWSLGLGSRP